MILHANACTFTSTYENDVIIEARTVQRYLVLYLVGPRGEILRLLFVVLMLIRGDDVRTRRRFAWVTLFSTTFRRCRLLTADAGRARRITVYRGTLRHTWDIVSFLYSFRHFSLNFVQNFTKSSRHDVA